MFVICEIFSVLEGSSFLNHTLFTASKFVNTVLWGRYFYQLLIIHATIHITVIVFNNNHAV